MHRRNKTSVFAFILVAAFIIQACNKNDEGPTGSIEFGTNPIVENTLKALDVPSSDIQGALVTIVNESGQKVYEKEYLPFYSFGNEFVTKSLTLNVGIYQLTEFMLVDSSYNVIWSTPQEGSELAVMVNDPLPIHFQISAEVTSRVTPEVILVGNHSASAFGYVDFNIIFVDNFCIQINYESLCNQWDLDSVMTDHNGFAEPFPVARFVAFADGIPVAETFISAGYNQVALPYGYDLYELAVFDCGNQVCFSEVYSNDELQLFACDTSEVLYIDCSPTLPEITITPEEISEPTIEQWVFGLISEPGSDSTINDVYPVQGYSADLYLYKMEAGDTLSFPAFGSCYVYPDIHTEPYAIVRSNSQGYFQIPLESGEYSYMVQTPYGFYIDLWISSRYPGSFTVESGKVTSLNIYVQPCLWF